MLEAAGLWYETYPLSNHIIMVSAPATAPKAQHRTTPPSIHTSATIKVPWETIEIAGIIGLTVIA